MRLSESYFFTLREHSRDEDSSSGNLLVRAGMIRKTSSGVYMFLPLGLRVMHSIENIIREEMEAIGSQEVSMPALISEEVYIDSGRRENFGSSMFSLKDRFGKPFVLGPTHEELFADAGKMYVHSYKDLPASLYQFQTKYRDEPRPRFGLIRVREFVMKDAYTFDRDIEGLDRSYARMFQAYKNVFDRLGLDYAIVRADTGVMGGLLSEEFQALTDIGEDTLVTEPTSGYAANLEVAGCIVEAEPDLSEELALEHVDTPNAGTIEDVTNYLGVDVKRFVKTLIYVADGKPLAAMVRGDRDVNETKLRKLIGASELELAEPNVVAEHTHAPVGFAGPVGLKIPIAVDAEVLVMKNFITGANENDKHIINTNMRDFKAEWTGDIRNIQVGDMCENGAGPVQFKRGIEVGNTFKLGDQYAKAMDLYYVDQDNTRKPVVMGSYGIGLGRCIAAIVEQNHSDNSIHWPKEIAPIQVAVIVVNSSNEEQMEAGESIYRQLSEQSRLRVALDDRDERAGVKFNDMELVGAYARITVGRTLKDGQVELKVGPPGGAVKMVALEDVATEIEAIFR